MHTYTITFLGGYLPITVSAGDVDEAIDKAMDELVYTGVSPWALTVDTIEPMIPELDEVSDTSLA